MNWSIKKILIILLLVLFVIVLFLGFLFFVKNSKTEKNKNNIDHSSNCKNIEDVYERNICWENEAKEKKDIEICKNIDTAYYSGNCEDSITLEILKTDKDDVNLCSQIKSEIHLPYCFSVVAEQKNYMLDECNKLKGDLREICEETFLYEKAIKDDDVLIYAEIKSNVKKQVCFSMTTTSKNDLNICNVLGDEDKKICMEIMINKLAIENKDMEICKKIGTKDSRDSCIKMVQSFIDPDKDNLKNEDEEKYGTDPANPDSDGDGFLDGDEVKNGYNPMGEGKLAS